MENELNKETLSALGATEVEIEALMQIDDIEGINDKTAEQALDWYREFRAHTTFAEAISVAADGRVREDVLDAIVEHVQPLCTTPTGDGTSAIAHLWEWIAGGVFDGNETPESLAAEWDALNETEED